MAAGGSVERNGLVWLSSPGWQRVRLRAASDETQAALVELWASNGWPLVVRRQGAAPVHPGVLDVGLPAPAALQWRKLALTVERADVVRTGGFPRLDEVVDLVCKTAPDRAAARDLAARLADAGVTARVYGSWGWQWLTGQAYVHADSDLDVQCEASDWRSAVAAVQVLAAARLPLRLDGELAWPSGHAVAWRELGQLLAGAASSVLVKHRCGVALMRVAELQVLTDAPTVVLADADV